MTASLSFLARGAALALLAAALPAPAQDAFEPLARLRAVAEAAVRQGLPASAEVNADALDPRLRLPACATAPEAEPGPGRGASVNVGLRCAAPAWTVYVPVRVRDLRSVLVLTRAVRRGEPVDAGLLRRETRDVAQLPFGFLPEAAALAELEFRRPLAAGQAPAPADLAPVRCVRRGDLVTLVGRAGGIEVRAEGKALADGGRGSRIRVENSRSRRVVEGTIAAPGVVEL